MVPIIITGRSDKITHGQKEHVKEKVQKLERYFNGITRIEAVLDRMPERCRAELVISVKRGAQIVVHCDDKELYAAVDLVIDKAETQLTRHKERVQGRRATQKPDHESYPGETAAAEAPDEEGLESYDEIIDKREFD